MSEEELLIAKIMVLGFLVNQRTDYCVFVRYSGHVHKLEVEIARSKNCYNAVVLDSEFYTDEKWRESVVRPNGFLKTKVAILERILKENDIDYSVEGIEEYTETISHARF